MNKRILDKDVQQYIRAHRHLKPSAMALKKSPFADVSSAEIATQMDSWQRSVSKLPTWAYSEDIYYPLKINLEQCSSEHTALVKQTLIRKGAKVIDLTGGFGVDSCYIAQEAAQVVHCDLNEELSQIVNHNNKVLGVHNITCITGDGLVFLEQQPDNAFDYVYIDPSRRVQHQKVYLLEDCEPNILAAQSLFFEKAHIVITKLSPMLDIQHILNSLNHIKWIYVISLDNDCKELLVVQQKGFQDEPQIRAIRLFKDQLQDFIFTYSEERAILNRYKTPQEYLYEPDVSITKSGAFKSIGRRYNLAKIHQHTHLYTSDQLIEQFPGKIFKVQGNIPFGSLKKSKTATKSNVVTRNFPLKPEEIKKKYKITDGGEDFLFFTTDIDHKLVVLQCQKVEVKN